MEEMKGNQCGKSCKNFFSHYNTLYKKMLFFVKQYYNNKLNGLSGY